MVKESEKQHIQQDIADLGRFGYAQELFRTMGGFSNFAISFSIISILTGAVTLYDYGLSMGGPAEMAFGFFLQAEDGIRDARVTGVQTCALPISPAGHGGPPGAGAAVRAGGGRGGRR